MPLRALAVTGLLALAACGPKVDNGGYMRDGSIKNQITVGKTTEDDVKQALGSPSAQSSFGNPTWYYITERKEAFAFFRPEVVRQDVTRIEFDKSGVVSKVENYSLKDGKQFALVKRTTPTEGHTLGFFEQVLSNIGRFNAPNNETSAPGRKPY